MNEVINTCVGNGWSWLQGPLIILAGGLGITGFFMAVTGTPLIKITHVHQKPKGYS